jgi:arylsulfatase A-like enzyme
MPQRLGECAGERARRGGRGREIGAEQEAARRLYDGEVHYADRLAGSVLDALAVLGLSDHTLVVITADHGEELFDRQALGHGHTVYDELLHVPPSSTGSVGPGSWSRR